MKSLLTILLAFFFALNSSAQELKNSINFQVGSAIPIGQYSQTDNSNNASYATTGIYLQADFLHTINKLYIGGQLSLFTNGFNTDEYDANIEKQSASFLSSTNGGGYAGLGISATWGYNFYSSGNTVVGGHLKIGYLSYGIGELQTTLSGGGNTFKFITASSAISALTGTLGIQLKSNFSNNFSFLASLDYMFAKPTFENVLFTQYTNGNYTSRSSLDGYIKVRNIIPSVGIGYNF